MSPCQHFPCPHFLPSVSCKVLGLTAKDLSVRISQASKREGKKRKAIVDGQKQMGGRGFPSDLYIFTGKFTGGNTPHLISATYDP